MQKKIKKLIKFVVSFSLVFGLLMPSYAALSASDGSAFVTKAEFDSALADFNSRLTTFEAGINSKIDSQVTSYLDRNGIWSGKDQDILPIGKAGDLTQMADSWFKCIYNSGSTSKNWTRISKLHGGWAAEQYKIIEKCNKAGLLYMTWRVDGRDSTGSITNKVAHGVYRFHKTAHGQYEAFCFVGLGFTKKENNTNIASWYNVETLYLCSLEGTSAEKTSPDVPWSQPYFGGTSMFFVAEGDPVFFGVIATSDSGDECWVNGWMSNTTSCPTKVFLHVMDAKVY